MSDTEARQTHWSGQYLAIHQEGRWEYVSRVRGMGAAVLLALDGDHVILVEQYRVPLKAMCLELPAGLVGDETDGELPHDAATRELEEETGYRAATVETIGRFCSSPGMTSESFTLLRATGLTKVSEGGGTESEDITVHRVPLPDIDAFVAAKRTEDCIIDVRILILIGAGLVSPDDQRRLFVERSPAVR
jgi:ADP-ribose pyrophosphatase